MFCLIVAPVISSSTVPLISLARAREIRSRPPALELSDAPHPSPTTNPPSYILSSEGVAANLTKTIEPKSPPLPTPPLAQKDNDAFESEMEKALGKVGKPEDKALDAGKNPPLLELSIPIGLH
jgi:hypothetical protein